MGIFFFRLHKGHVRFALGFALVALGLPLVCVMAIYCISIYTLNGVGFAGIVLPNAKPKLI